MSSPLRDPAENGFLRLYYRDWRPTRFGMISNGIWAWASGLGLLPPIVLTLETKDIGSGRFNATVLVPVSYQGARYLVSMLGDTSRWVQNVRASSGHAFIKHGRARPVLLTEIPVGARAPVLKAWCQIAISGRRHLPVAPDAPFSAFEAIAENYPVFRIDAAN